MLSAVLPHQRVSKLRVRDCHSHGDAWRGGVSSFLFFFYSRTKCCAMLFLTCSDVCIVSGSAVAEGAAAAVRQSRARSERHSSGTDTSAPAAALRQSHRTQSFQEQFRNVSQQQPCLFAHALARSHILRFDQSNHKRRIHANTNAHKHTHTVCACKRT